MDSSDGVFHHLADAWGQRHDPAVTLIRYADLLADLHTQVHRLARTLELPFADEVVAAATFDSMRRQADRLVPDAQRLLVDRSAFFRRGRSGEGTDVIAPRDHDHYRHRVRTTLDGDLASWLHP